MRLLKWHKIWSFLKNAVDINTNFLGMSDSDKLAFLMKTDMLQYKIASTLQQMNRRRRSTVIY